jgi:hypothetical protein
MAEEGERDLTGNFYSAFNEIVAEVERTRSAY